MNTPKRQPSKCHRSGQHALARNDSLLPWADPYIANLQRQYQLDRDEHDPDRPDAVAPRKEIPQWTTSDSPKPPAVNRLARTAVGWAMRRTPVCGHSGLPGI